MTKLKEHLLEDLDENISLTEYLIDATVIYEDDEGYYLEKEEHGEKRFIYSIFTPWGDLIYRWRSNIDFEEAKDFTRTTAYNIFTREVEQYKYYEEDLWYNEEQDEDPEREFADYWAKEHSSSTPTRSYTSYWKPIEKQKGFVDKLCNSDTLVFHRDDSSTRMLCQIYEGKGWDVLTTSCNQIDDEEVKQLFEKHDRLVFLGHGTSYGLMGMFGPEVAKYMEGKKIFAIWCNADRYFKEHNIGQGCFVTGNMPSEVGESIAAGCGRISRELMLENITYWSKLCADVCEACLEGDVKNSVDYIRKDYLEKYGNHPVTIYNSNRTQCLGEPQELPAYEFKGQHLELKDYPIPNFDEEAFLLNPAEKASECPVKKID